MRSEARRLAFGILTLLGIKRRGFFIPHRHADAVRPSATYPALEPIFAAADSVFLAVLDRSGAYAAPLAIIGGTGVPDARWDQDWFPRLDAAAAYVIVRSERPRRIVEVGSGHSTRFLCRAVEDGDLSTEITAIDPAPRAVIEGLGAVVIRSTLQDAGLEPFTDLAAGDVLFIDSSHILMPGTDVDVLFNTVLPMLPAGVLVHVHDVFLPDAYPPDWLWRGYNEQLGVATLLQGSGYRLLWASHYVATRMAEDVAGSAAARLPLLATARESSLWLVKS
jgi:predicted O-methyltransferase YrrM